MSECMTQEDAMNMSNEQAVNILIPLKNMMRDQHGCPISDAYFALEKAIFALRSAQPERRWIPCSERLPKAFEHCLWTTTDGKVVYHYCDGQFSKYIAWMPLPYPYQPERETDGCDSRSNKRNNPCD